MEFSDFCDVLFLDDLEVSDVDLMHKTKRSGCLLVASWVCLKTGYTPNYSHLVGIMIINHWV